MGQKFTNITPIQQGQSFTNVTPIGGPDPNNPAASIPKPQPGALDPNFRYDPERKGSGEIGGGPDIATSLKDAARGPAYGAAVVAPMLTGGASLPIQMGVGAASGAAQSALGGDKASGIGTSAAIGAVLPLASELPISRIARTSGKLLKGIAEDVPLVRQAGKIAKYWKETEPAGVYPGASQPEAPAPQLLQGRALAEGAQQTDNMSAGPAALNKIPARGSLPAGFEPAGPEYQPPVGTASNPVRGTVSRQMKNLPAGFEPAGPQYQPPTGSADNPATGGIPRGQIAEQMKQPPIQRPSLRQMMDSLNEPLNESVGASPPPAANKPIYQRGGLAEQMKSTPATDIPEGHTPVESSALKSYKYDAAAREFHVRYGSGDKIYVFGDVSPEEARAFEGADSKGKAMQAIARNPEVARIINGKRMTVPRSGSAVKP